MVVNIVTKIEIIKTPGGHRKYNVDKYLKENKIKNKENDEIIEINDTNIIIRKKYCYIRVSTVGQKDDLKRQREYMEKKYPEHEIIEDIGSGINFNRNRRGRNRYS